MFALRFDKGGEILTDFLSKIATGRLWKPHSQDSSQVLRLTMLAMSKTADGQGNLTNFRSHMTALRLVQLFKYFKVLTGCPVS